MKVKQGSELLTRFSQREFECDFERALKLKEDRIAALELSILELVQNRKTEGEDQSRELLEIFKKELAEREGRQFVIPRKSASRRVQKI